MAHVLTPSRTVATATSSVFLIMLLGVAASTAGAADGDLDPLFGSYGVVTTRIKIDAIAIQSDNRIVVAGDAGGYVAAARYERDGSLDLTCGFVSTPLGSSDSPRAFVTIDEQSRIVIGAGTGVVRFTADCIPDLTFGSSGQIATPPIQALAVQPDGRIVVVGGNRVAFYDTSGLALSESGLEPHGTAFCAPPPRPCVSLQIFTYTILPSDIILGVGSSFLMVAYDASGRLLGPRPPPLTVGLGLANAVAGQPDGKIVAAGLATADAGPSTVFMLARYLDFDASVDSTFNGGIVTTSLPNSEAVAIALQENGRIVAAGTSEGRIAVVRYLTDGTLDESFGASGIVVTDLGIIFDQYNPVRDVEIESNGDILVAAGNVLVRYLSRPPTDPRLYYLSGGSVQELAARAGAWYATDLSSQANASFAAGTSLAAFAAGTTMTPRVYYLDGGSNVQELAQVTDNGTVHWEARSIGLEVNAPPAAPGGALAAIASGPEMEPRIYYFDRAGLIQELAWFSDDGGGTPARWHVRAIGEEAHMPRAADGSALAALSYGLQREPRVYYLGQSGLVHELAWFTEYGAGIPPYWHLRTISEEAHKPPAALDSSLAVAQPSDTPRVYYTTDFGDVKELRWLRGPNLWYGEVVGDAVTNSAIIPSGETVYSVLPDGVIEQARIVRGAFFRPLTSAIDPLSFAVPTERADALHGSGMVWLEDSLYYISAPSGIITRLRSASEVIPFGIAIPRADLGSPLVGFTVPAP